MDVSETQGKSVKRLIAIKSCRRDSKNGFNQAVRDTWLKDCPIDYRFFVGEGDGTLLQDEEPLECGDGYMDLPAKTRAIFKWVLPRDYDYAFLADTDTYVNIPKLLVSGFENYDLTGKFNGTIGVPGAITGKYSWVKYAWVSGGAGYWISRRAMTRCADQTVIEMLALVQPDLWAEDMWISQVVGEAVQKGEFTAKSHPGYGDDNEITSHYCSAGWNRTFNTEWMFQKHKDKR